MRNGGVGWEQGVTALSEWSSFFALIRGMASLSLLLWEAFHLPVPLKALDSRSHLPDNCCTEGWSCVLNNCA